MQYHGFYSKKTFEILKKYVFNSYPTQPRTLSIESMYCLVSSLDGKRTTTNYHILEITKNSETRLRLRENEKSIGVWETITSMGLQGIDYNTLILGTKKNIVKIDRSDMMFPDTQTIRYYDFPDSNDKTT